MIITISLSTANLEIINFDILNKIYNLYKTGGLNTISLEGNLYSAKGYKQYADELVEAFSPNLVITIPELGLYLVFEDSLLEQKLITSFSSDGFGVTLGDAANANLGREFFKNDTDITSFNEFKYFTKTNTGLVNAEALFLGASNLEHIDMSQLTTLYPSEFKETKISIVNIPNLSQISGQSPGSYAFRGCNNLITVQNLGSISVIPTGCFSSCSNLLEVTLPLNCSTIKAYAFQSNSSLVTINNISNVTEFETEAVSGTTSLSLNVSLIENVVTLGNSAFANSAISGIVNLPNIVNLEARAFYQCPNITKVICLNKVISIPLECFCPRVSSNTLKEVYLPKECITLGNYSFYLNSGLTTVKLYVDSIDDWVEGLSPTYTNLFRITTFGNGCFNGCTSLSLTNADVTNATSIGAWAFSKVNLTGDISLSNLTTLGEGAFYQTKITSINLTGSTITTINKETFKNCSNLSEIILPSTVTDLREDWADKISDILTIKGLDNVSSHSSVNYLLSNKTILNPIKTSLVSESSLFVIYQNNKSSSVCLYYEPLRTSTRMGYRNYTYAFYSLFANGVAGGTGRMSIGLLYYRDITSFGNLTFFRCNIDNLVINNVTPPTLAPNPNDSSQSYYSIWGDKIFPTGNPDAENNVVIGTLWVPDSAVATYLANSLYSHLNIKGIGTKTNGVDYDLPRYATYSTWEIAEEAAIAQNSHAPLGLIEEWM